MGMNDMGGLHRTDPRVRNFFGTQTNPQGTNYGIVWGDNIEQSINKKFLRAHRNDTLFFVATPHYHTWTFCPDAVDRVLTPHQRNTR